MRRWLDRLLDVLAPERALIRQHERYRHALQRICKLAKPTLNMPGVVLDIWWIAHDALNDELG